MVTHPDPFLFLVATLFDRLSATSDTLDDEVLVQLQSIFGPMLMSALQLVDRREVVNVTLPTGRSLHQVTSATGQPYTINISLPPREPASVKEEPLLADKETEAPKAPSKKRKAEEAEVDPPDSHIHALTASLGGMYCPCTGFAYNSLAGENNFFCKHLLAVVLAHQLGREVHTTVPLQGVVGLLGLNRA